MSYGQTYHYDVYLTYHGKNACKSFALDLHSALRQAGLAVYINHSNLTTGGDHTVTDFSEVVEIEGSRTSIIIFSSKFDASTRFLQELEKILERRRTTGLTVVPVFYDVDRSELRHQEGVFARKKWFGEDKAMRYRAALIEVANMSGFRVRDSMWDFRDKSKDINDIVQHLASLVEDKFVFLVKHPVGVEARMQDVIQLLNKEQPESTTIVGIWGINGIGKTTIAKAVYNQMSCNFEGQSFLSNINEICESKGLISLQRQLLSDIYKRKKIQIDAVESGKIKLRERLCRKKILLVLHNVNKLEQLNALCGSHEWFAHGSKIIITTSDRRLLRSPQVDHIYRMKYMDINESLELFSWHTFKTPSPIESYADLCRDVVEYCGGLPLALEVIGSFLFDRSVMESKIILEKLKTIPNDMIMKKLRTNFDDLDVNEKNIFLDVATLFIGMDKDDVIQTLSSSVDFPENGITILGEKSLVTIDSKNRIGMHTLVQAMGREILRQESTYIIETKTETYDVFLSFRGEDSRVKFISHLDSSLRNAGIYVFKDDDGIQRGDQVSVSLLQAIGLSRICIVVLSTNYANSKWCMMELERIVEISRTEGMVVVPVFYEVDPSEVRNQTGEFGKAFDSLISTTSVDEFTDIPKEVDEYTKRNWKTALHEVGSRAGVVIINSKNESEDIKKIVELVTRLLDKTELFVADHPVGVESRVQDVIQLLNSQKSKDPLLLGIWGMGGIGKTTLAKAVYNKIRHDFDGKSFLFNVREVWKLDNDKVSLQQRLLSDIYKTTRIKINTVESGKKILMERLCAKRIFLVIDDVNKLDQLNALCGNRTWFGKGSRIIITTRDEDLLSRLEVDHVYRMHEMDDRESLELFNWHAFKQPIPGEGFTSLSRDVVKYSGGLPLALQVIGSFLFTKRREAEWESVLEKLKLIPNEEVSEKLKISFDGLSDDDMKDIFLDIAFFFIGMDREDVTEILKDCGHFPEIGISTLIQQSLVTVDRRNKIGMHDLLRDMGREIVRKKSKEGSKEPSRIWRYEDVHELPKDTISLYVKGLTLKMSRLESTTCLETKTFENMDRLKLLQFAGVQLDGEYNYLSKELRWLCWHGFPLKFTPEDFHQGSLVALDLQYSNLEQVWRKAQLLVKLKILNLSHSHNLRHTPNFSKLPNLEKLILKDCPSLSSISSSIGRLRKILYINLKDCTGLCELPRSIYKLDSVKTLILSGCTKIVKLEEDIEQMKSLTILVADNTAITRVPFGVVKSKSIAYISLCGFEGLTRKVFPSIIQSWLSPTNNVLSLVQTSAGTPCLDFTDEQNKSFYCLPSTFEDLKDLQRLWLKCDSEAHLNQIVASILYSFNTQNCEGLSNIKTTASIHCRSQVGISSSKNSLTSLLIQMGMSCNVTDILTDNILQKISPTGSGLLPGDNSPNWLTFNSNDSSVTFEVPEVDGRNLKTIMCIVYSSADNATTEGFKVVLVINYTKNTIQVYKRDGLLATSDEEEWQRVISNIEPGNIIKVIVGFTNEFIVKMTTIYLVYDDQPIDVKTKHCQEPDKNSIVSSGDENRVLEQIVVETHLSSQTTVSVGQQISQVQPLQTSDLPEVVTSFGSCVSGSVKSQTGPKSDPSLPKETSPILSYTDPPQEKEGENQSESRGYSPPHSENDEDNQDRSDSESYHASSSPKETMKETEFPSAIQDDHEVPITGIQILNVAIPPNIPIDDELQTGLAAFNIDLENDATAAIESFLSSLGFSSDLIVSTSQGGASSQLTTTVESLVQELRSLAFDGPPFDSLSSILALDQSLDSFKQKLRVHQHLLPASQLEGFTTVLTNLEDIVKTYRGYEQERKLKEHSESEVAKFAIAMNESKNKCNKYQNLISDCENRDKEIITKVEALKREIEGLEMEQRNLNVKKESSIEKMNSEKRVLHSQAASLTAHQSQLRASRDKLSTLDNNLQQCKATYARFKEHPPF